MQRNKEVSLGASSRKRMLIGMNILGDAVKITLGPKGRNVVIEQEYGRPPHITKDGVTVAKSIKLRDYQENMGAELIKSVSERTNKLAGDGTTTSTVLAQAMINEGIKSVTAGMNPMDLKRGMDIALQHVLPFLPALSTPVETDSENLKRVTTISANSDEIIGNIVANALSTVGPLGSITFGESNHGKDAFDVTTGFGMEAGWLANYFITDPARSEAVLENPLIMLVNEDFTTIDEGLVSMLGEVANSKRPLLIIARDCKDQAMATFVTNHAQSKLRCCVVKAPGFGDRRGQILEDLAIVTGATVIDSMIGRGFDTATTQYLGTVARAEIGKDKSTLIGGTDVAADAIKERLNNLHLQYQAMDPEEQIYEREKLKERMNSLAGKTAIIRIGASSELEMKEKRDRYDDAVAAGRAALEEGIVAGGGAALLNLERKLDTINLPNEDQMAGVNIFRRALRVPFDQILKNAGLEPAAYRSQLIDVNVGVDASDGTVGNMIAKGIIDPAKVTRVSLEHSTSIAGLFLTTEGAISLDPSESISADELMAQSRGFL